MKKILIIDDDPDIITLLRSWFKNELAIDFTYTTEYIELRALIANEHFDLYLIDLNLREFSGFDVVKLIEKKEGIDNRIIMFSAAASQENMIKGYDLGVANFIEKPLKKNLVSSIMRKNLRAIDHLEQTNLSHGAITLNPSRHECLIKDGEKIKEVDLTPIEFRMLSRLISSHSRVVSKEELSFLGKDRHDPMSIKSVEMHIASLRNKLEKQSNLIKTKRGVGYSCS
jgi:DNA-binding response OmpR family regulator